MNSLKLKWILFIAVVFLIGDVFGFLTGQVYQNNKMHPPRHPRNGPPPGPKNFVSELQHRLSLTTDQATKIETILETNRKRIEKELVPFRVKAQTIREEVQSQIESVLTPEQKVKYKQFRDKMEKEREKRDMERRQPWDNDTTHQAIHPPPPSRDFLPPLPPK